MKQNVENRNQAANKKNEKQNPATESKMEPVKENATVNSHEGNVKLKDGGFISMLLNEVKYSLQGTTQGRYLTGGVPPVRFSM